MHSGERLVGRTRRVAAACAFAAVLVSACGAAEQGTGPLVLYPGEWNGDDALLTGRLLLDENGCIVVQPDTLRPPAPARYLLAFSVDGTSWDERRKAIHIPGRTLRVGEEVQLGGSETGGSFDDWTVPPADACGHLPVWLVGL